MTFFRKCKTCLHISECDRKEHILKAIKGLGITTLSHRCSAYAPMFSPGDNLWVKTVDHAHPKDVGYYDDKSDVEATDCIFPAHFCGFTKAGRAIVYIKPGATDRDDEDYVFEPIEGRQGFCSVALSIGRSRLGIESRRDGKTEICKTCSLPLGTECPNCTEARNL